jgi:hypothetical protein
MYAPQQLLERNRSSGGSLGLFQPAPSVELSSQPARESGTSEK